MFNYFTSSEIDKFTFYRMPKLLITDDYFKKLSCEAKMLYGLLLDRASLSQTNRWIDEDDRIYVYFTQDEAKEMLNIGVGKTVSIFNELEKIGLILRKKQGQGKPVKIYVMNFAELVKDKNEETESEDLEKNIQTFDTECEMEVKTSKNRKSEFFDSKKEVLTSKNRKSALPKNESLLFYIENKTDMNKTDQSIKEGEVNRKSENNSVDRIDRTDMENAVSEVKSQIGYEELPVSDTLDAIVQIMAWIYLTPKTETPIAGVLIDTPLVKSRFKKIEYAHIRQLLDKLSSTEREIKNKQNYLLTCLYNAPIVISTGNTSRSPNDRKQSFDIDDLYGLSMFND